MWGGFLFPENASAQPSQEMRRNVLQTIRQVQCIRKARKGCAAQYLCTGLLRCELKGAWVVSSGHVCSTCCLHLSWGGSQTEYVSSLFHTPPLK